VEPLDEALTPFSAWITGRKRSQSAARAQLAPFEAEGGRIKVNPLAAWSSGDVAAYLERHKLPPHPLVAEGYPSIGCVPCTTRVKAGEDVRAGRWRGSGKIECGIHKEPAEKLGSGI
jgi:phosphoadenosine phosphosulfate reductase